MKKPKSNFVQAINLDGYRKDNLDKLDAWTTSVTLEKFHREFLERERLNLSKLVRDFLNDLMKGNSNE